MKTKNLLALAIVWALLFWATSATSSYIHEQNGTISICDPNDSTKCITMKDRNEWSSETWYNYNCFMNFSSICSPWYEALWTSSQNKCIEYFENQGIDWSICVQNLNWYTMLLLVWMQ